MFFTYNKIFIILVTAAHLHLITCDELKDFELLSVKYLDIEINFLKCKSKSSSTLMAILCSNIEKAFIFTKSYYSNYLLKEKSISNDNSNVNIFQDQAFIDLSSDDDHILISSENYFYLVKGIGEFKIIKFPFEKYENNVFAIFQAKVFHNSIVAQVQSEKQSQVNYIFILIFQYDSQGDLSYWVNPHLYQLPPILSFQFLRYHLNFCNRVLMLSRSDNSICVYLSNFETLIESEYLQGYSYLLLFQITLDKSSETPIGFNLVKKIKLPYSCGVSLLFPGEVIIFGCPYIGKISTGQYYGGLIICPRNNCSGGKMQYIPLTNILNTVNFKNVQGNLPFGSDLTAISVDKYQSNFLILVPNFYSGEFFILSYFQSQFHLVVNTVSISNFSSVYYGNSLYGMANDNQFLESNCLYEGNFLLLWIDNINEYINLKYESKLQNDTRTVVNNVIKIPICDRNSYYNSTLYASADLEFCRPCENSTESSNGLQSVSCEKCENSNNISGSYCPFYCPIATNSTTQKIFGTECLSCQEFVMKYYLPWIKYSDITFINNETFCDFQCSFPKAKFLWECQDQQEYANDMSLFTSEEKEVINIDACENYTSCFECYNDPGCAWCKASSNSLSSCRNKTAADCIAIESELYTSELVEQVDNRKVNCISNETQQQCGNLNSTKFKNMNSIEIILTSNMYEKYFACLWEIDYVSITNIAVEFILVKASLIKELKVYDATNKNVTDFELLLTNQRVSFQAKTLFVLATLGNSTENRTEILSIKVESLDIGFSSTNVIIISVSLSLVAIIVISVFITYYYKKSKRKFSFNTRIKTLSKGVILSIPPINSDKNGSCSEFAHIKLNTKQNMLNETKIKGLMNKKYPNDEAKNKFLSSVIQALPKFRLDQNYKELTLLECKFCERPLKINQKIILLECDHFFHYECLDQQVVVNESLFCLLCSRPIIKLTDQ